MIYVVEYFSICLLAICLSSLERDLLRSLVYFKIRLFVFLLLSFKSSLYNLNNSPFQVCLVQIFLPVCGLSSQSLNIMFCRAKSLIMMSPAWFFLSWILPLVCIQKSHHYSQDYLYFLLCYCLGALHFTFLSVIHFQLILWKVRSVSRFIYLHVDVQFSVIC